MTNILLIIVVISTLPPMIISLDHVIKSFIWILYIERTNAKIDDFIFYIQNSLGNNEGLYPLNIRKTCDGRYIITTGRKKIIITKWENGVEMTMSNIKKLYIRMFGGKELYNSEVLRFRSNHTLSFFIKKLIDDYHDGIKNLGMESYKNNNKLKTVTSQQYFMSNYYRYVSSIPIVNKYEVDKYIENFIKKGESKWEKTI